MISINSEFPLRDLGISNALGVEALPRHRWYFIKEAFSPTLVQRAVEADSLGDKDLLLDPFSGSGTVALAGAMTGVQARGFEVNPFLRFLSHTKMRNAPASVIRRASEKVLRASDVPVKSPLEGVSTFTRGNRWGRWLFPTGVLRSFEAGSRAISDVPSGARGLLKLALIGAAMDCCNAVRDGKCLRYPKGWKERQASVGRFQDRFQARVRDIVDDLSGTPIKGGHAEIVEGDARQLVASMTDRFRLCVTSPPYLNSFDYSDVYRPELFLGGFVNSTKALMQIRMKTVRSHVQANWTRPTRDQFGSIYRGCIERIRGLAVDELWDRRLPLMVQAYFEDMEAVLGALRAKAHKNASLWLVVSTSAYGGIEVPVDLILAEIGQEKGWCLREVGVLRYLRSSSQHVEHVSEEARKSVPLRETVVIFDASPKR